MRIGTDETQRRHPQDLVLVRRGALTILARANWSQRKIRCRDLPNDRQDPGSCSSASRP